jgi:hypothetical protein
VVVIVSTILAGTAAVSITFPELFTDRLYAAVPVIVPEPY